MEFIITILVMAVNFYGGLVVGKHRERLRWLSGKEIDKCRLLVGLPAFQNLERKEKS